ncbi:MAG: YXWGXW repeat-containing protein [Kofleriaceae bacterium]
MNWWVAAMTLVLGCGGSNRGVNDPAAEAREAERNRIEAMRPDRPFETRAIAGYRAPSACGQGPYRIETTALGAQFGEQLEINICAPRSLQGDYRLTVGKDRGESRHFGSRNNSDYCRATTAEAAQRGEDAVSGSYRSSSRTGSAGGQGGSASITAPEIAESTALTPMSGAFAETCPEGMFVTGIVDYSSVMQDSDGVPWEPGTALTLELWSAEPLHLDGAVFVVIQRGVRADMTVERWKAFRDADARWTKMWNAYLEGEVSAGRIEYADMTARTDAPPPPRIEIKPPKPSRNAEWITGYWQRDREWIWSPGFWRVPESDIVAENTIEAPVAPPPVKTESPAPPPPTTAAVNVVWTPGYWSWNGNAYLWIEGVANSAVQWSALGRAELAAASRPGGARTGWLVGADRAFVDPTLGDPPLVRTSSFAAPHNHDVVPAAMERRHREIAIGCPCCCTRR